MTNMKQEKRNRQLLSQVILNILDNSKRLLTSYSLRQFFLYELREMYHLKRVERKELLKQKRKFYNTVTYLKRAEFVTASQKNGIIYYSLTDKGKLKSLLHQVVLPKNEKEVKFSHLVLFDIPENCRRARTLLRKCLYNLGYEKIQKSCFCSTNKRAYKLMKEIINKSKLKEYVKFFEIKKEV